MRTICDGYYRHSAKEWYVNENGVFVRYVKAEFDYYDIDESFDRHGDVVGEFKTNQRTVLETKRFESRYLAFPIQIDYNFYLIDCGRHETMDEIYNIRDGLNNSNLGIFGYEHTLKDSLCDYEKIHLRPYEVVLIGHSRNITRSSYSSFLELDYKQYKNRFDKFMSILKKSEHGEYMMFKCNKIFHYNIELASYYYNTTKEKILKNDFNRQAKMIERLQNKITYKQKNK